MSTAVRRARDCAPLGNEKPEPDGLWFAFSSGEWIRTTPQRGLCDLRVMSQNPESVPHRPSPLGFVRRVLQTLASAASAGVNQTDERWFLLAGHAAAANRCSYSIYFTWVRQEFLSRYI
jgi:hypothetical protein